MEWLQFFGFSGAIIMGFTLGLFGGGGSILAVPILVYLLGIEPVLATAYSLFIVGLTALLATYSNLKKGLVCYKTAVIFAIPAFIAVYITRRFLIPSLPEILLSFPKFQISKDLAIMLLFAVLMVVTAVMMIKGRKEETAVVEGVIEPKFNFPLITAEGSLVGVLTGIVGAGGGFLIVPALVLLARLPIKLAIGTSLSIIAAKSLIGFLGDINSQVIDWSFLLLFSGLAILGMFLGTYSSTYISAQKLKKSFGWFVLIMGLFILGKEAMNLV